MPSHSHIQIIDSLDRGLSYAESCFETFRVVDGAIFLWDKHWQRLNHGLRSFGFDIANQHDEVLASCLQTAQQQGNDTLLRLTVSGGDAPWGLQQSVPPNIYIQAGIYEQPAQNIRLQSVEYPFPVQSKPAKFSADYAHTLQALQHWQLEAPQSPLVCKDGFILGGITANIALLLDGMWLTPEGEGILSGCVRQYLIEQGILLATPCKTQVLEKLQAAVLLNSGAFVQGIEGINGKLLDHEHIAIYDLKQILTGQKGVSL